MITDWRREEQERTERAKTLMYEILSSRFPHVTRIIANYNGSNDEGWIDDVVFTDGSLEYAIEDAPLDQPVKVNQRNTWSTLGDVVDNYCDGILEAAHPGWEINEGSEGTITIDVKERKAKISHRERYISYSESEDEA